MFRSSDGGATWTNVGLAGNAFIGSIVVSPSNPDEVLVAAIGDRTPGPTGRVYRTTNGGRTWAKVLFLDNDSGCPSIAAAPDDPRVVYASLYPAAGSRGAGLVAPLLRRRSPPATSIVRATAGRRFQIDRRRSDVEAAARAGPGRSGDRTAGARRCRRIRRDAWSSPVCATACFARMMAAAAGRGPPTIRASSRSE